MCTENKSSSSKSLSMGSLEALQHTCIHDLDHEESSSLMAPSHTIFTLGSLRWKYSKSSLNTVDRFCTLSETTYNKINFTLS